MNIDAAITALALATMSSLFFLIIVFIIYQMMVPLPIQQKKDHDNDDYSDQDDDDEKDEEDESDQDDDEDDQEDDQEDHDQEDDHKSDQADTGDDFNRSYDDGDDYDRGDNGDDYDRGDSGDDYRDDGDEKPVREVKCHDTDFCMKKKKYLYTFVDWEHNVWSKKLKENPGCKVIRSKAKLNENQNYGCECCYQTLEFLSPVQKNNTCNYDYLSHCVCINNFVIID